MFFRIILLFTIFIPIISHNPIRMYEEQHIDVIWVNTPYDQWNDTSSARSVISTSLAWWERIVTVRFSTTEYTITVNTDFAALNLCRQDSHMQERNNPTLYMIAYEPRYGGLTCDGVVIGDYNEGTYALVDGNLIYDSPTDQAIVEHTIGHLFGAADTHKEARTYDIMDKDYFVQASKTYYVVDRTLESIGAIRIIRKGN